MIKQQFWKVGNHNLRMSQHMQKEKAPSFTNACSNPSIPLNVFRNTAELLTQANILVHLQKREDQLQRVEQETVRIFGALENQTYTEKLKEFGFLNWRGKRDSRRPGYVQTDISCIKVCCRAGCQLLPEFLRCRRGVVKDSHWM